MQTINGTIAVQNTFDDKEQLQIITNGIKQLAINNDCSVAVAREDDFTIFEKIVSCMERARKAGIAKKLKEQEQKLKDCEKQLFEQFKAQQKTTPEQSSVIKLLINRGQSTSNQK